VEGDLLPRKIKNETPHGVNHGLITKMRRTVLKRFPQRLAGGIASSCTQKIGIEYEFRSDFRFLQQTFFLADLKKTLHLHKHDCGLNIGQLKSLFKTQRFAERRSNCVKK
jgi:hypothetical protein